MTESASAQRPSKGREALLEAVRREGGDWTTSRAQRLLMGTGQCPSPHVARNMLNILAEEGHLTKHGKIGRLWTPAVPPTVEFRIESRFESRFDVPGAWQLDSVTDDEEAARQHLADLREGGFLTYRLVEITSRIIDDGEA